jgi:hypothetical protein
MTAASPHPSRMQGRNSMMSDWQSVQDNAARIEQFAGRICVELSFQGHYCPLKEMGEAVSRAEEWCASRNLDGSLRAPPPPSEE